MLACLLLAGHEVDRFPTASAEFRSNLEAGLGTLLIKGMKKYLVFLAIYNMLWYTNRIWLQPDILFEQRYHMHTKMLNISEKYWLKKHRPTERAAPKM